MLHILDRRMESPSMRHGSDAARNGPLLFETLRSHPLVVGCTLCRNSCACELCPFELLHGA